MLVLVLPALRQVEARTDVSIDFFYDNLSSDGNWVEVGDYGYCWQPSVAVSDRSWRPYADGYWAYTDVGWTWVSNEDFGWATYHYGRWTRLRDRGWFWVPGREWGPAWVSWRTGGDYVGWAPLPPRGGGEVVYENGPINAQVDLEFDIGPSYYNFVDVRYMAEPRLRDRLYASDRNETYISSTVNVTNITYSNSTFYNYGPDYNTVNRYSTRPIARLTLQRDNNADLSVAIRSKSMTRVQGDRLMIAAPLSFQKPPTPVTPKQVKEKIQQANFDRGWNGDQKTQTQLRQKMKSENAKTVAPPTVQAVRESKEPVPGPSTAPATSTTAGPVTAPAASTPPPAASAPAASTAPTATAPAASMAPAATTTPAPTPPAKRKDAKTQTAPSVAPSSTLPPATAPVAPAPDKPKKEKRLKTMPATAPVAPDASVKEPMTPPAPPKDKAPDEPMTPPAPRKDKGPKPPVMRDKAPDLAPAVPKQPNDTISEKPMRKPKEEHRHVDPAAAPLSTVPPAPAKERMAPPKHQAPPEVAPAPPKHQAPPEVAPAPPKHQAPPEVAPAPPKERIAPPPGPGPQGPGPNGPVKQEGPGNKPNKKGPKGPEPTATPGA
ncbi:MAG: hypothetical protein QOH88_109 [Verrucomicrobiota bacterium]